MQRSLPIVIAVLAALFTACGSTDESPPEDVRTAEFYNHNAQQYYDGSHYGQALQQFEKALEIDPEDQTALLGRAWSLVMLGQAQILRGDKAGAGNTFRAKDAFEEIKNEDFGDNTYKIALGLGQTHVLLGDLYGARIRRIRNEVKNPMPGDPRTTQLNQALAAQAQEYDLAESFLQSVLAQKDVPGAKDNLTALLNLARIDVFRRDYAGALLFAERYLEQVRRSKELWVESIRLYPEDKEIWEIKLAGAVSKEVEVRDLIANTYFKLDKFALAEEELNHIILLTPERGDAYLNRGIVREEMEKYEEALADYKMFLRMGARIGMDEKDPEVVEAVKRIMRLEEKLGLPPSISVPEGVESKKNGKK